MKTFTALEVRNRFGQVIDAAQRGPVTVTRQGRPIMTPTDFLADR